LIDFEHIKAILRLLIYEFRWNCLSTNEHTSSCCTAPGCKD